MDARRAITAGTAPSVWDASEMMQTERSAAYLRAAAEITSAAARPEPDGA